MSCKPVCKLCDRLVLSQAVTFTGGNLEINLPAGAYNNGEKYCIVVAQAIPDTATINAPVYFTIGTGTTLYHRHRNYPLSTDQAYLCSGYCMWNPYTHPLLCLCSNDANRWLVPYAGPALLLP